MNSERLAINIIEQATRDRTDPRDVARMIDDAVFENEKQRYIRRCNRRFWWQASGVFVGITALYWYFL